VASRSKSTSSEGFGSYPKTCVICGKPVRITGSETLWFHTDPRGKQWSAHYACVKEKGLPDT